MWHKLHIIGFKAEQRLYLRSWCVSTTVVCLTLTMLLLSYILKQYVDEFDRNKNRLRGSYKQLNEIKGKLLASKLYRCGLYGAGRVPHIDYVYFKVVSKSNALMKIDQNWKGMSGSYKKLYGIKCIILSISCSEVVYRGLDCFETGCVPHIDYVYFKAVFKRNILMTIDWNWKRLKGLYKKLCDIKCIILATKLCRGGM